MQQSQWKFILWRTSNTARKSSSSSSSSKFFFFFFFPACSTSRNPARRLALAGIATTKQGSTMLRTWSSLAASKLYVHERPGQLPCKLHLLQKRDTWPRAYLVAVLPEKLSCTHAHATSEPCRPPDPGLDPTFLKIAAGLLLWLLLLTLSPAQAEAQSMDSTVPVKPSMMFDVVLPCLLPAE